MESAGGENESVFSNPLRTLTPVLDRKDSFGTTSWEVRRHSPSVSSPTGTSSAPIPTHGRKFSDLFPDDLTVDNKDLATDDGEMIDWNAQMDNEIQKLEEHQQADDLKMLDDIKALRRETCKLCKIKWEVQQALNVATNRPPGDEEPPYEEVEAQSLRDANLEEGNDQEKLLTERGRDWQTEIEAGRQSCMEYECQLSKLKESIISMDKTAEYHLRTKLVRSTSNLRPRFELALPSDWDIEEEPLEEFMDVTISPEGCLETVEPTGWAFQEAGLKKSDYILAIFFGQERRRVAFREMGDMDEDELDALFKQHPISLQFLPNAETLS